eukprot:15349948-Ditylum_brightwellii.AAC.1
MESDPPVEEIKQISEGKEEEAAAESEDLEIEPPLFAGELLAPIFAPVPPIIGEEEELEDPISPPMTTPAEKLLRADRRSTAWSEEDIHAIEVLVKNDK